MRHFQRCLPFALAAAMLAGCATTTGPQSQATVGAYQDTLSRAGRLSVNYDKDGKLETLSGKFAWTQKPGLIDVG